MLRFVLWYFQRQVNLFKSKSHFTNDLKAYIFRLFPPVVPQRNKLDVYIP